MPNDELSLFSYEVLGLVGRRGAGPHDMVRFARRDRMFGWSGERRYYAEPKRLCELGYLERQSEPGQTHVRTVYRLTDNGLDALREFAATPARFTPIKSEVLIRLMIADLAGETATLAGMGALHEDIADLLERLQVIEESAESLPHRRPYIRLVAGFMRQLFELHLQLVQDLEREVGSRP